MKLSIIVPVYNGERFLEQCLDSIINQTFTDFELIIINDGSTDSTEKIIYNYALKDARIHYFNQENKGIVGAVIAGINRAKGDYISFVDADDYCDLTKYEKLMSKALEFDCDMVACSIIDEKNVLSPIRADEGFYKDEEIIELYRINLFTYTGYCTRYNKVIKTDIIKNNFGIYKKCNYSGIEDYYFHSSYFFDLKRIYLIKEALCHVRIYENTNSTTKTQRNSISIEMIEKFYQDMKNIYISKGAQKYLYQIYSEIFNLVKAVIVTVRKDNNLTKKMKTKEIGRIICNKTVREICKNVKWKKMKTQKKNYLIRALILLKCKRILVCL